MSGVGWVVVAAVIASLVLEPTAMAAGDSVSLPSPRPASAVSVEEALASRRSIRDFADAGLSLEDMAQLLWAAQGITHAEGLRTAPSAGALYPLEVYLVAGRVATLPAGIYRYDPRRHQLAPTALGDRRPGLAAAALHQTWIADAPAVVVIGAVFRRTSVRYGERGERYLHIEAGHAAENVCLQAVALGLGTTVVGAFSDVEVKRLLGLGEEQPLLLIPVGKPG
jgi:SagB-type dehydrogenase family enzyme